MNIFVPFEATETVLRIRFALCRYRPDKQKTGKGSRFSQNAGSFDGLEQAIGQRHLPRFQFLRKLGRIGVITQVDGCHVGPAALPPDIDT